MGPRFVLSEGDRNDIRNMYGLISEQPTNTPTTPEEWQKEIRSIESKIGNPSKWTMDDYNLLQNKLNEYKKWRETTPEGKAVVDYHNEPNEYVVPLPPHLKTTT